MSGDDLIAAQRLVRRLPVGESVGAAILALVRSARSRPRSGERQWPDILGSRPAREPSADAGGARPRPCLTGVTRRRSTTCLNSPTGAQAPHGADLCSARGRRDDRQHHFTTEFAHRVTNCRTHRSEAESEAVRAAVGKSRKLAGRLPRLSWKRAASPRPSFTVCMAAAAPDRAKNFWQYGASSTASRRSNIDWRRSARDDHLYVRLARMGSLAHHLAVGRPLASMDFNSHLTEWSKARPRAGRVLCAR